MPAKHAPHGANGIDLPALARLVAPLVVAQLAAALGSVEAPYSTRRGHGPTGYGHRQWQRIARTIGTRRGRWFVVTPAELAAYEGRKAEPPKSNVISGPWSPTQALADAGLRGSR